MSFSVNSAMKESCRSFSLMPSSCCVAMARLIAMPFARSTMEAMIAPLMQIAAVKRFLATAAQSDFEKFVFVATRKLPFEEAIDQAIRCAAPMLSASFASAPS